jgi:glucose-6-phosphate 1-epimerase
MLSQLNQQFSSEQVQFVQGEPGFTKVLIDNQWAKCEIYLHGAHVTSFIPHGKEDLLWLSQDVAFVEGKSIRGGIPVCWPWFGAHASDPSKGAHGFVRLLDWQVSDVISNDDGQTQLIFSLRDNAKTQSLWPVKFALQYKVTIGQQLTVALTTTNLNAADIQISEALHSYFRLGDIAISYIEGLDGVNYIDTVNGRTVRSQIGDVVIDQEVDRVYYNTQEACMLVDEQNQRKIEVFKSGSNSTIVWNPWIDKASSMPDVNDEGYQHFVCVESGNVFDDRVTIAPGQQHTISQTIKLT